MAKQKVSALLVTHLPDVRYLCGFTGSNAALAITAKHAVMVTDGRYTAQAAQQVKGAEVRIAIQGGYFDVEMRQHGLLRWLRSAELSDGTLRYLLLVAALLSPRPPPLMVLNEPETSLHPDLLPPLARLIVKAAGTTQILVVTHAEALARALAAEGDCRELVLTKELGETLVEQDERPRWQWPAR